MLPRAQKLWSQPGVRPPPGRGRDLDLSERVDGYADWLQDVHVELLTWIAPIRGISGRSVGMRGGTHNEYSIGRDNPRFGDILPAALATLAANGLVIGNDIDLRSATNPDNSRERKTSVE